MNKALKIILIISISVIGAGFLAALPANAIEVDELVVEYSSDGGNNWLPFSAAIFNETNFLPGQDVTRLIRVTNNSESTQRIAVEAVKEINIGDLASQLDIVIKEGSNTIYSKTLKQFFNDGEIYLSSLTGLGSQTQYDFTVSFKSGAEDNKYQGKSAGFNLLVGFEGTEGGLTLPPPGGSGGGGGGGLPPGLTILDESVRITTTTEVSVTITWTTSYLSTSQVIYAKEVEKHTLDLTDATGTPPKYGYERTTSEYDAPANTNGTTSHTVTITGLDSGTKYYYRSVSHGSLAIGREYSFTTLGVKTEEEKAAEEIVSTNETPPKIISAPSKRQTSTEQPAVSSPTPPIEPTTTETPFVSGAESEIVNNRTDNQKMEQPLKQSLFLATISSIITLGTGSIWVGLLILLIIGGIIYYFIRKERRKNLK